MKDSAWGQRALDYARMITDLAPGRGSATEAEARAAETVRQKLADLGVSQVSTQTFQGLRSIWLFLAQAYGIALVGHAAYWLLEGPAGGSLSLAISLAAFGFSFYLLWRKFTFRDYPLRQNLPHGPSQNVIAVLPPQGQVTHRLVLLAHLDSHRAVWLFAHPLLARFYAWLVPVAMYGVLCAPLSYILAALTGVRSFAWLGLALAAVHFLAWFTGVTADLGAYSPGANDNASAVGSVLALAERLRREPLQSTEVWLAFTGCEETGGDGMLKLLTEHGPALKEAMFLDFELVGIGEQLAYLEQEGLLRPRMIPAQVRARLQRAAQAHPITPKRGYAVGAFTEIGMAWEHGFQGACLLVYSREETGLPQWHRLTDTIGNLRPAALGLAHDFAWEFVRQYDIE